MLILILINDHYLLTDYLLIKIINNKTKLKYITLSILYT